MDPSVVVRSGVDDAPTSSCLLHVRADGGEGGSEMVEGSYERSVRVPDGEGDKLNPSPVFPEGPDEGGYFLFFLCEIDFATGDFTEADLDGDDVALFLVEGDRVWRGGGVWEPPSLN